ncbi:MAG TPA: P27 family phage terminase small subunit [Smithellaceae bacterium]|jgi:phage terminase small subunit|nr:P27 family phage terminase small subunit [Smithellaceae bacterium]
MVGRKKTPDKLKKLRGTDQPCRMTGKPPLPEILRIEDIDLSALKTERAKAIFIENANYLIRLELLNASNILPLAMYANNLDILQECMDELAKSGKFKEKYDENGNVIGFIENPYLDLWKKLQPITVKQAAEFGFTPVSGLRFAKKPDEKDELQQILDNFN